MRFGPSLEARQREMRERYGVPVAEAVSAVCFEERHYAPSELAGKWGLSVDVVRRLFQTEPGVLVIGHSATRAHKRSYTTLRIPQSVAAKVYSRLQRG